MNKQDRPSPPNRPSRSKTLYISIAVIWAAIMVAATLLIDEPRNTVPFWLLLIAYYITVWGKSVNRS